MRIPFFPADRFIAFVVTVGIFVFNFSVSSAHAQSLSKKFKPDDEVEVHYLGGWMPALVLGDQSYARKFAVRVCWNHTFENISQEQDSISLGSRCPDAAAYVERRQWFIQGFRCGHGF